MEVEMVRQYSRFVDKKIIIVHQKDSFLATFFKNKGYESILDPDFNIRDGKAEGMVIGVILAKIYNKDMVGFIDSDNYVPGAVNEYVKIFAAGFGMSPAPYCNVRVSWVYKPKIRDNSLQFAKWGRISEVTNRHLNTFLSYITGFETEVIKTGNSGEHAFSMPLAERLHFSTGYSVEPYEFIDIFEKFGGLGPSSYPEVMEKGVEIFQIFFQETSMTITERGGYVLKYAGDSVLAFFPLIGSHSSREDDEAVIQQAVECGREIVSVIQHVINPILNEYYYPELAVRIGIDRGQCAVVLYGKDRKKSYVDVLGPCISLAAKMKSLAKPDNVIIGQTVYDQLPVGKNRFSALKTDIDKWNYVDDATGGICRLYQVE